jgi:hypothetical protein
MGRCCDRVFENPDEPFEKKERLEGKNESFYFGATQLRDERLLS